MKPVIKISVLILLFLFLLTTSPLFSQEEKKAEELFDLSLSELMKVKIVTPGKDEQELWQSSSKTIVITGQMIKKAGYLDLLDVLRNSPYFQIQSEHGHWTKGAIVNFAGFRSGDAGNNKVLLLIDGIKISDDGGEGMYMGLNSIPLHFVKQIEIVYGPNSTMYGRDAYAGMINIITQTDNMAEAGYSYGTFNTQRIFGNIKRDITEDLSGHLFFNSYKSDEQDPTGKSVSYLQRHVFPQPPYTERFYRAQDNLFFDLGFRYKSFSVDYIMFDIEGSETYGSNPDLYVSEYSTQTRQINKVFSASYSVDLGEDVRLESYYNFKKYEFDPKTANLYTSDLNRSVLDTVNGNIIIDPLYAYGGRKYYYFRTVSHKAGVKSLWQISPSVRSVSGVDYSYIFGIPVTSEGKGGKPITTEDQRLRNQHTLYTIGMFSEFSMKIGQYLLAAAGGRFDLNSIYPNTFMPRASLTAKFKDHLVKLMFSRGYLAPSITQMYFESITNFSWIRQNEDLMPEKNTYMAADWSTVLWTANLGVNVFFSKFEDTIVESVQSGDSSFVVIKSDSFYVPILQSRNLSRGRRYGLSISAHRKFSDLLSVNLNYSFIDGHDDGPSGKVRVQDNLVSKHSLQLGINLSFSHLNIYTEINYFSNRRIKSEHSKTQYAPLLNPEGYLVFKMPVLVNLTIRSDNIWTGLSAYVRVKNLFNKEYYGQTINANWGSPKILQDLRRIDAGIEYEM